MTLRVLVTRTEPGAQATAGRIWQRGHQPVVLPMSRTVAMPNAGLPGPLSAETVVAVTSAAALRHAPADLIDRLLAYTCVAVGDATAMAAREAGFRDVRVGPGDAERVADILISAFSGSPVLFLAGRVRRPVLETRLRASGMALRALETYDTIEVSYSTDFVSERLEGHPVDAVLVQAQAGLAPLMRIASEPSLAHLFDRTRFLCMSPRLASGFSLRGGQSVSVAAAPNEDSLLALLDVT